MAFITSYEIMIRQFSYVRWLPKTASLGLLLLAVSMVADSLAMAAQKGQQPPPLNIQKPVLRRVTPVIERSLKIQEMEGAVTYLDDATRPAQAGDRLKLVKDGIRTGNHAKAVLMLDDGITPIQVSEQTEVRLKIFRVTPQGGNVTWLLVPRGQINFRIQRFNNPTSRIKVETPAGVITAERGDLGITISPDGKTGIATRGGAVIVTAQAQSIVLKPGYSTVLIPGEPPFQASSRLMKENVKLDLETIAAEDKANVRIKAGLDPMNLVYVN
ncbi:MAG: FecR domain-containing protein, partial [Leptolyngbyaceae bacterium]|nr:FecR domain-containing protein [Leptolyngbyaceae bacterium]